MQITISITFMDSGFHRYNDKLNASVVLSPHYDERTFICRHYLNTLKRSGGLSLVVCLLYCPDIYEGYIDFIG